MRVTLNLCFCKLVKRMQFPSRVFALNPWFQRTCRWAGGNGSDTRLFTASYDGSVRILDPAAETFTLAFSGEDAELSAMDVMADGRSGFIGDKDGNLELLDFRSRRPAHTVLSLHDRKINTLHVGSRSFGLSFLHLHSLNAPWDLSVSY